MDDEDEDFRLLPGFTHAYMINRDGIVRNYRTGIVIKPMSQSGTWSVKLYDAQGIQRSRGIRGLIKRAFVVED